MAYRESPDTVRALLEQVERELADARAGWARIPALLRERDELRAQLPRSRSPRRTTFLVGLVGLLSLLVASGAFVATRGRSRVPDERTGAPTARAAQRVLPDEVRACVAGLPRAPDFHVINDFTHASRDLQARWTLTRATPTHPDETRSFQQAFAVRLDLVADGIIHGERLGVHAGHPYTAELSICRDAPPGTSPCSGGAPPPEIPGVLSELSVQDWDAYHHHGSTFWMLVRTPSAMLLLRTSPSSTLGRRLDDRLLCEPGEWQLEWEIPLGSAVHVEEAVFLGDPVKPFDCAAWGAFDGRCTG